MAKRYKTRLIKRRESYSFKQICELFGVHERTVQGWKQEGLKIINDSKPHLVPGADLKEFLMKKQANRKTKLQSNEFYCTKCRQAVRSTDNEVFLVLSGKTIGKDQMKEIVIKGACEYCNTRINRFSHEGKLQEIKENFDVVNLDELGYE